MITLLYTTYLLLLWYMPLILSFSTVRNRYNYLFLASTSPRDSTKLVPGQHEQIKVKKNVRNNQSNFEFRLDFPPVRQEKRATLLQEGDTMHQFSKSIDFVLPLRSKWRI